MAKKRWHYHYLAVTTVFMSSGVSLYWYILGAIAPTTDGKIKRCISMVRGY